MANVCGERTCRAQRLTTAEFEKLGAKSWTQSFRSRLGLRARKLFKELYGKAPNKVRSSTRLSWRNKVGKYPCGILEQAYAALIAEGHSPEAATVKQEEPIAA